jgi:capsular polysaccharide biosynthesis protein
MERRGIVFFCCSINYKAVYREDEHVGDKVAQEINLYHLLRFYAKKWAWIVSLTIVGLIAGFIYNNYIQIPLYKSDATLLVVTSGDGASVQNTTIINNYVELLKSRRVLGPVIDEQKPGVSYEDLLGHVETTNGKSTQVIKVSISTKGARTSQLLLEGAINSFKQQVVKLYTSDNVRVVDDASLPDKPYNVHEVIVLAIASAAGLLLSIIALFFVYDFRLSRGEDIASDDVVESKPKKQFNRKKLIAKVKNRIKKIKKNHAKKTLAKKANKNKIVGEIMQSVFFDEVGKTNKRASRSRTVKSTVKTKSVKKSVSKPASVKPKVSTARKRVGKKPKA